MPNTINVLTVTRSPIAQSLIDRLRAISPRFSFKQCTIPIGEAVSDEVWHDVEVLYTFAHLPKPELAPNLRWVQLHSAGVDHIADHPLVKSIKFTTMSGIHAPNMAEYVMMMMLAFAHHMPAIITQQKHGQWPPNRWELFAPTELRYATIGVVGYGSIGREVARLARAFGMRILAMKRDVLDTLDTGWQLPGVGDPETSNVDRLYAPDELHAMLVECDYVVLTLPLTPSTQGLMGVREFAKMKHDAVLLNVSRGNLVDEVALVDALRERSIGGAVLDVFSQEPLASDSPLWTLPNVIISPHIAGFTTAYIERAMTLFAANLGRYLDNDVLINVVNPDQGY